MEFNRTYSAVIFQRDWWFKSSDEKSFPVKPASEAVSQIAGRNPPPNGFPSGFT